MLRITQQDSSAAAKRYYAASDYYTEGQEIVGGWGGKGAERLGLNGVVDRESFDRLCDNRHPATGRPLTVRTRTERTVGYDFTFSVPKSVSLLYAMSGDQQILEAFRAAVDETMREMEAEMKARVRKGRKDVDRETGNLVWAEFIHTTSRPVDGVPDPQLHAHCFVFNATFDSEEDRWKAGQFRHLKADAPYFQAAFRLRLAGQLQDLGFGVERKRDDFELSGVPADTINRFSRRTQEIERVAAEKGITDPKRKDALGAETREGKVQQQSWHAVRREWDGRLTHEERERLAAVHRREEAAARETGGEGAAVDSALAHCFSREAVVRERKLLTEAMKRAVGRSSVEDVRRELAGRALIRGEQNGQAVATTAAVLTEERRVIDFARKGRGRFRPLGDVRRPFTREWLNEGQRAAVRHVLGSRDRVTLIRGAAGTGKTRLMQEAVEALSDAGRQVFVFAPSVDASHRVLRSEGFAQADTVARLLVDTNLQQRLRGQVIWVDEAGLLSTEDMAKLFDLAGAQDARIVLSGDKRQHRAVARGEPLRVLEEGAGLPVAEVTEIMRQEPQAYKRVVELLSEERIAEGFALLDQGGGIREVASDTRYAEMAASYLAATREKRSNGEDVTAIVVSPTHAEGARITQTIRSARKAEGRLGEERGFTVWRPANLTDAEKADPVNYGPGDLLQFTQHAPGHAKGSRHLVTGADQVPVRLCGRFEVYRPATASFAAGDRIRVTANGWTKDRKHRLGNGALFTLKGFTRQGDLELSNGWVIGKDFGHLTHGYVVTSHAAQGQSVDKVFIGQSSLSFAASNRRQFYVSVSRGKQQAIVFTDNKQELLRAVTRTDTPLSASELAAGSAASLFRSRLRRHTALAGQRAAQSRAREVTSRAPAPGKVYGYGE